ncbi:phosphatase PAP2 family protein [Paenibacillus glacialis]|uniref:phosphatase PAP2 family protein n=1 Tax=Paenibacillus glacialis TaxID=494026 RepID=UPI0013737EEE|nr:phosphatase PAP2 family protein [Paenibacillus glacialis]
MSTWFNKSYVWSLSLLGSLGVMGLIYNVLNSFTRDSFVLTSPIDDIIPLVPAMSLPYLAWYPYIFLAMAYLCWKDRQLYFRTLFSMNISVAVCYLIYYYFQTNVPRPIVIGHGWDIQLLQWIYRSDKPFNCFPSIHSLYSYLVMRASWNSTKIRFRTKAIFSICSLTIIISTFMVKQHVIYDAIGAILLGEAVFILILSSLRVHKRVHGKSYERYS